MLPFIHFLEQLGAAALWWRISLVGGAIWFSGLGIVVRNLERLRDFLAISELSLLALYTSLVFLSTVAAALLWESDGRLSKLISAMVLFLSTVLLCVLSLWSIPEIDSISDRDEALEIGVEALMRLENPWNSETQLGNPISPQIGGLLLVTPFVAIFGSSSIQSIFWWLTLLYLGISRFGLTRVAGATLLLLVAPPISQEWVTQSDLWVNTSIVSVALALMRPATLSKSGSHRAIGGAVLLALGALDRVVFLIAVPIALLLAWSKARPSVFVISSLSLTVALLALVSSTLIWFPSSLESLENSVGKAGSSAPAIIAGITILSAIWVPRLLNDDNRQLERAFFFLALVFLLVPISRIGALLLERPQIALTDYSATAYNSVFVVFLIWGLLHQNDPWKGKKDRESTPR